jgi:hypothetical protein
LLRQLCDLGAVDITGVLGEVGKQSGNPLSGCRRLNGTTIADASRGFTQCFRCPGTVRLVLLQGLRSMLESELNFTDFDERLGLAQAFLLGPRTNADGFERPVDAIEGVARLGSVGSERKTARPAEEDDGGGRDCGHTAAQRDEQGSPLSYRNHRRSRFRSHRRCSRSRISGNHIVRELDVGAERGKEIGERLQVVTHSRRAGQQALDLSVGSASSGHLI